MKINKRKKIIYSTNSNYEYEYEDEDDQIITPTPQEQHLRVCIDKHRSGKTAIIIKDFKGTKDDLKILGKILKSKCGVGGTVKKGEIIIQGDIREKVVEILEIWGYNYKRVGG